MPPTDVYIWIQLIILLVSFLGAVPPGNIFNYDETNIQDEIVPPMIVYKVLNEYTSWTEGGPPGAVYENTKSGWFDSETFEHWFFQVFLPFSERKEGENNLFGDNLASHFNENVVQLAKSHNIYFIMLPQNATHLMQPLDVAVFSSVKRSWRSVLDEWKVRTEGSFDKRYFRMLLSRLWNTALGTMKANMISGFRATGLYPMARAVPLSKLPQGQTTEEASIDAMDETLIELLKKNRGHAKEKRPRGRKIPRTKPGAILYFRKENGPSLLSLPLPEFSSTLGPSGECSKKRKKAAKRKKTPFFPANKNIWMCRGCGTSWVGDDDDGNRWVLCNLCDTPFHLQCAGIDYDESQYYDIDIDCLEFFCEECENY